MIKIDYIKNNVKNKEKEKKKKKKKKLKPQQTYQNISKMSIICGAKSSKNCMINRVKKNV